MPLLALDTSTGACSVALLDSGKGKIIGSHLELMPRGHAEALAPMVADVMNKAGCQMSALTRLGVTTGPGAFTGVRIGIAFARALAAALDIPLAGVTTLRAIAANVESQALVAAIMDARRGEVYMQLFGPGGEERTPPQVLGCAEAAARLPDKSLQLVGSGAELVHEAAGAKAAAWDLAEVSPFPDARRIARLAYRATVKTPPPGPLYLRRPDAKLPSGSGLSIMAAP